MNVEPAATLRPISASRSGDGFSSKRWIAPLAVEAEDAHAGRLGGVHRQRRDGDVGVAIEVGVEQLRVVHAVQVIAGQNQVVVGVVTGAKCRAALRTASAVPWNQSVLSGVCSAARISTKPLENVSMR